MMTHFTRHLRNLFNPNKEVPLSPVTSPTVTSLPAPIDSLPVSCLVKGIVKSIETEPDQWQLRPCWPKAWRHQGQMLDVDFDEAYEFQSSYSRAIGVEGYKFNELESILVGNAICKLQDDRRNAFDAKLAKIARERAEYFDKLGCPDPTSSIPFRTELRPITIQDTPNNRKLFDLLYNGDAVKRKAAEEAAVEVLGRAALVAWKH